VNQTYDPLLESVPLKRLRAAAPRGPAMGTALVLERAVGDPVVVAAGQRIPDAHFGNYTVMHHVDVANRAVSTTLVTPSADNAFPFTVAVSFGCQVTDPVVVVRDGIRDMAEALRAWLAGQIRPISMRYDVLRPTDAEMAIASALGGTYHPDGLRLSGFAVAVTTEDTGEIVTAQRELRVLEMRREGMRPVARGGRDEMLAHVMALSDGDPTPLLDREQEAKESSARASLDALATLMGSDRVEEFNRARIAEKAASEFFPGGEPLFSGKRPGIRDRIERKRKVIESGDVTAVDAEIVPTKPAGAEPPAKPTTESEPPKNDNPGGNGARSSRIRGLRRKEDS
jgi:hypothetical protein